MPPAPMLPLASGRERGHCVFFAVCRKVGLSAGHTAAHLNCVEGSLATLRVTGDVNIDTSTALLVVY